ncbi:hypothetical protein QQ045_013587 [Rhodiola kirilowii]
MEYCIEARALKPSLRHEIDVRSNQNQASAAVSVTVTDELVYESDAHGGGFMEDFLVDDLLDFTEKDVKGEEEELEKDSLSDCSVELETDENGNSTVSGDFLSLADDAGLAVPQDDLADLEWVSRFVDDSMPEFPPLYPTRKEKAGVFCRQPPGAGSIPVQLKQPFYMKPIIPAKPRTKRQRLGRVWSVGSTTASEASTTSSSLSSSSIISNPVQFIFSKPVSKRQKTEPKSVQPGDSTGRRCSHCQVQKTPQWRAGPEGAKTLCNACGVRFKSGRLYPEYRPACSPTFREDVHSNSHRKVIEMRKKKEVGGSGLAVESC